MGPRGFEPIADSYWASFLLLVGNWHVGIACCPNGNITPLWSISLEEQFYRVWPWFILLARRHLVRVSAVVLLLSAVACAALLTVGACDDAFWTFTMTRMDPIALGVLMAGLASSRGRPELSAPRQWLLSVGGFLLAPLYLLTAWSRPVPRSSRSSLWRPRASRGTPWSARDGCAGSWSIRSWSAWGRCPIGMYVLHYDVVALCVVVVQDAIGASALASVIVPTLAFGLTWPLAEASYRWLETPFAPLAQAIPSRDGALRGADSFRATRAAGPRMSRLQA